VNGSAYLLHDVRYQTSFLRINFRDAAPEFEFDLDGRVGSYCLAQINSQGSFLIIDGELQLRAIAGDPDFRDIQARFIEYYLSRG
jgi:hypothetical protein